MIRRTDHCVITGSPSLVCESFRITDSKPVHSIRVAVEKCRIVEINEFIFVLLPPHLSCLDTGYHGLISLHFLHGFVMVLCPIMVK